MGARAAWHGDQLSPRVQLPFFTVLLKALSVGVGGCLTQRLGSLAHASAALPREAAAEGPLMGAGGCII